VFRALVRFIAMCQDRSISSVGLFRPHLTIIYPSLGQLTLIPSARIGKAVLLKVRRVSRSG